MVMNVLRSRKFAKRVLLILLILIIPAFVLWGVGSITQQSGLVGQIGRQKVRASDLAKSAQGVKVQVLLTYFNDPDTMNRILQNRPIINHMAWERLVFKSAARSKGIKVTDRDVMAFIVQHPLFQRNGVFDIQVYNYILRNMMMMEPAQFEKLVKENLMIRGFRQDLFKGVEVNDEELLSFYKFANDKVDISYILIDKDLFLDKISVRPEEAREFYEENKDMFFSPAKVGIEYLRIPYEEAEDKDAAAEQSRRIYAELRKAPEKFRETAEKNGLDYGKTEPFSREELIPGIKSSENLHNIAFSLKEGEIGPPVLSGPKEGSVYIIRRTEYISPALMNFEKVEEEIMKALSSVKCIRLADEKANDLYSRIATNEITLEKAGKINGQLVKTEMGIKADGYIQNIGPAGLIVTRALKGGEGEVVSPIIIKEKGALLVRVDKIIPADEAGFEEKKEEFRQSFLARKQMEAIDKWMEKNSSKIKLRRSLGDL